MWLAWLDKRYMVGNEHRTTECESDHVLWQERNQFWLPTIMVPDAEELVSYHSYKPEAKALQATSCH